MVTNINFASPLIEGVEILHLKQIIDNRGAVYHYLKSSYKTFTGFGESYFSKINPNVIKGWKCHTRVFQHFCVPFGEIKIVIFDNRSFSATYGIINEFILNDSEHYNLLCMPPNLWYSFKCMSNGCAILANTINEEHSPNESNTLPLTTDQIPYEWN